MVLESIEDLLGHLLLARAAGAVTKLIAKEGKPATIKLPSGEVCLISKNCSAIDLLGSCSRCSLLDVRMVCEESVL
jgi:ribosomal protein L2